MKDHKSGARILVVDDNPVKRYTIVRSLSNAGFETVEAASGTEALKLANPTEIAAIILDIKLPDINGFEVRRILKSDPATRIMPIMHLSGHYATLQDRIEGLEAGADAYLTHPFDPGELVATLNTLLRMRRAEQELSDALRSREMLIELLSHDLKNGLTSLGLNADAAEISLAKQDYGRLAERIHSISRTTSSMTRLLESLVDWVSINAGKFTLNIAAHKLGDALDEALLPLREIAQSKGLHLEVEKIEAAIPFDFERVCQVIGNLAGNAVKFTPATGRITIRTYEKPDEVIVAVSDTGRGIPAEELSVIFDKYWRDSAAQSSGSGLGLYIANAIVKAHGGRIWAESEVDKGTTVYFSLPKKQTPIEKSV